MWILFERINLRSEGHVNLVVDFDMALRETDPNFGVETPVVPVVEYTKGLEEATVRGIQQGQSVLTDCSCAWCTSWSLSKKH
jgi:hypothetical protein